MDIKTHAKIDPALCGAAVEVAEGRAVVELETSQQMAVDEQGLVHGGFVFGAADHAAMLAINHPNVVLGASTSRFKAPVRVGERVRCEAVRVDGTERRQSVEVKASVGDVVVFEGTFTTFVLDAHVLAGK